MYPNGANNSILRFGNPMLHFADEDTQSSTLNYQEFYHNLNTSLSAVPFGGYQQHNHVTPTTDYCDYYPQSSQMVSPNLSNPSRTGEVVSPSNTLNGYANNHRYLYQNPLEMNNNTTGFLNHGHQPSVEQMPTTSTIPYFDPNTYFTQGFCASSSSNNHNCSDNSISQNYASSPSHNEHAAPDPNFLLSSTRNASEPSEMPQQQLSQPTINVNTSTTGTPRRKRLPKEVSEELDELVKRHLNGNLKPTRKQKDELARCLNMTKKQIDDWFLNKRRREKHEKKRVK